MFKKLHAFVLVAAFALATAPTLVKAEDEAESRISASFGADLYSHFISYGNDVWNGGATWNAGTVNPWAEVSMDFDIQGLDSASVSIGTWWDVNDNATSPLSGGTLQEVDVYAGISVSKGPISIGVTGQEWYYGGNTETILDISFGIDDSQIVELPVAINPSFTIHITSDSPWDPTTDYGVAYVLGVSPSMVVYESDNFDVEIGWSASVGFSSNDFYAKSGLGYFQTGLSASIPLKMIEGYGDWSIGAGINFYHTPSSAIPKPVVVGGFGNPQENFVVGNIGFSVSI